MSDSDATKNEQTADAEGAAEQYAGDPLAVFSGAANVRDRLGALADQARGFGQELFGGRFASKEIFDLLCLDRCEAQAAHSDADALVLTGFA